MITVKMLIRRRPSEIFGSWISPEQSLDFGAGLKVGDVVTAMWFTGIVTELDEDWITIEAPKETDQ